MQVKLNEIELQVFGVNTELSRMIVGLLQRTLESSYDEGRKLDSPGVYRAQGAQNMLVSMIEAIEGARNNLDHLRANARTARSGATVV